MTTGPEWTQHHVTLSDGRRLSCAVQAVYVADGEEVPGWQWGQWLAADYLRGWDLVELAGDDPVRGALVGLVEQVLRHEPYAAEVMHEMRRALEALKESRDG